MFSCAGGTFVSQLFFYFDDKNTKYIIRRRPQTLDSTTSTDTGNTVAGSIHIQYYHRLDTGTTS